MRFDVGTAYQVYAIGDGGEDACDDLLAFGIFQARQSFFDGLRLAGQI